MKDEEIRFVPGGKAGSSTSGEENSGEKQIKSGALLRDTGLAIAFVVMYAGGMLSVEYVYLSDPIQSLEERKQALQDKAADMQPETADLSTFLATAGNLAQTHTNVAERLQILRNQSDIQIDPETVSYVAESKTLTVEAQAEDVEAITRQLQAFREKQNINRADYGDVKRTESGNQRFTLTVVFQ